MKTYEIREIKGESFRIAKVEEIAHLTHLAAGLEAAGKEPALYHMAREIEGTRKKAQIVVCYRFKDSGRFVTII